MHIFGLLESFQEMQSVSSVGISNSICVFEDFVQLHVIQFKPMVSAIGLPWSEISAIGRIPNLNALKLISRAFTRKTWVMGEGDNFPSLKFLKLESLDVEEWSTTEAHIPTLERLTLSKCKI